MPCDKIVQNKEKVFRLKEIARKIPGEPHPKTVYLWCIRGVRKGEIKLEHIVTTGGLMTSLEAYSRFFYKLQRAKE